jgi:hypothetical protein
VLVNTRREVEADDQARAQAVTQQKRIDLATSSGAALLGAGLGALVAAWLRPVAVALVVLGAALHGWGMLTRHRLERRGGVTLPRWSLALYWLCWLVLLGIGVYLPWRQIDRSY